MRRHLAILSCGFMTALVYGCSDDKGSTLDDDEDGFDIDSDCNDNDPDVHPDAIEICDDGLDNDCSGGDRECQGPEEGEEEGGDEDFDNDGYTYEYDCNDNDPDVNPDAHEDCMTSDDDNCDGYAPLCIAPDLIYAPTSPGQYDAYGVEVFADRVVFGEPSGGAFGVGDGRALFFDVESAGVVDEFDAVLTSEGEVGSLSAYGTVVHSVGQQPHLCIGGDYWSSLTTDEVGKSWCFAYETVAWATGTLELTDAAYTTSGAAELDCTTTDSEADVDGDGFRDLLVHTSRGMHVILGDGNAWSGDYVVPADADFTLGDCASSNTGWCGFARAFLPGYPANFAMSKEGGASEISIYEMPIAGGSPTPDETATVNRYFPDAATALISQDAFAFGNSLEDEVTFIDAEGNLLGTLNGPQGTTFGYWVSTSVTMEGRELLLVGAPEAESPEPGSNATGLVYVFDLDYVGIPTMWREAEFILLPPSDPDFDDCGHRARAGNTYIEMDAYTQTTIATSCRGHGGAVYNLYREFNGSRLVSDEDIYGVAPGEYEIRQWVVTALQNHLHWAQHLAQTEAVRNAQGNIVGWRLHKIAVDSPLYRAGLRNGDVIGRINGIDVTTPAVINAIYDAVKNSNALTVGFVRAGVPRLFSYEIVP